MEDVLSEVDIYVLPLQTIDIKMLIPVALLEAMARSLPCFISDLAHLHALVKDGEQVIFFDRNNPLDLAKKITTLDGASLIRKNAHEFAKKFPNYKEIAGTYFNLFVSIE
jgi:glycosyltransferase involved in cell wall biosynthesis